jgi:hypothetical protein
MPSPLGGEFPHHQAKILIVLIGGAGADVDSSLMSSFAIVVGFWMCMSCSRRQVPQSTTGTAALATATSRPPGWPSTASRTSVARTNEAASIPSTQARATRGARPATA